MRHYPLGRAERRAGKGGGGHARRTGGRGRGWRAAAWGARPAAADGRQDAAPLGGRARRRGGGAGLVLPAPVADGGGELRRRRDGAAGLGHDARQRPAARLVRRRRVVLHVRDPDRRPGRGGPRPRPRCRAHHRRDRLHAARAQRRAARQGDRARRRGHRPGGPRRRHPGGARLHPGHARPAAGPRSHRHRRADLADAAVHRPRAGTLVGGRRDGAAAGLGAGRRPAGYVRRGGADSAGLPGPGRPAIGAASAARLVRRGAGGGRRRFRGPDQAGGARYQCGGRLPDARPEGASVHPGLPVGPSRSS